MFERVEERLASFTGSECALLFGSGYAANIGLLQAIVSPDDLIVSDERNHASLIDGIRLTKARDRDLSAPGSCRRSRRRSRNPRRGRAFVITESVFSMDGDLTPLREVCAIAERDGRRGDRRRGARHRHVRSARIGARRRARPARSRAATMHTGGKALGSGGAWVAGSRALRDVMVNRARSFIFSTAPLPVLGRRSARGSISSSASRSGGARCIGSRRLLRRALAEAGVHARRRVDDRADHRGRERGGDRAAVRSDGRRLRRARDSSAVGALRAPRACA